jgi:hypothetical protein
MSAEPLNELIVEDISKVKEARFQLWHMGILQWKFTITQKKIWDFYKSKKDKTIVINCSRRLGKTYLLALMAIEQCLTQERSIVKFLMPEAKMIRTTLRPIMQEIFLDAPKELIPQFSTQDSIYKFVNGSEIHLAGTDNGNYEKLRGGNCLDEDTLILTPNGHKKIKDIEIGEYVYGYNKDGSTSLTQVVNKYDNGEQEVTDLYIKNKYIGACTDEHVWLTNTLSSLMRDKPKFNEKKFNDISEKNDRSVQRIVKIPCGNIQEPHAYVIGCMIGDGCSSSDIGNIMYLASEDLLIPERCANILNIAFKDNGNFSWKLSSTLEKYKHSKKNICNYYESWLKGKNAYTKNFDWEIVNTWDRESCLKLVAGLTDTDGNVYHNEKEHSLEWSYTSVNINLINNLKKLIFKLTQFEPSIKTRDHNGNNEYTLRIRNSFYVKALLKELTPYIVLERKRYQSYMDTWHSKSTGEYTKITKGERRLARVYDLEVNNETHLYLTSNGLVTHNCHLAIIDEAGFCSDLNHIIQFIIIPTTTLTKGRILLSSTTPPNPDHEFVKIMEKAGVDGTVIKKTIFDARDDDKGTENPRISDEIIGDIIKSYQMGEDDAAFRTEYLCEVIYNSNDSVIPEFTKDVQHSTICEWSRPAFVDRYVSMDIGFTDLTVALFAYWDFENGVLVVEDEIVINGPELTTRKLAELIIKKETLLWTDSLTGEFQKPYKRVSDNNLILINDLQKDFNLTFFATDKHNKDAYIGMLRNMVGACQVIINPRCKTLISHLKSATWDGKKNGTRDFRRSPDNGHYDALAALMYMVRNIDMNKNPYPKGYSYSRMSKKVGVDNVFQNPYKVSNNEGLEKFTKLIFNKKTR